MQAFSNISKKHFPYKNLATLSLTVMSFLIITNLNVNASDDHS